MPLSVANLAYCRPSDLVVPTWALASGTALSGYGVANLSDLDPSSWLWLDGTTMRLVADFGSAQRLDAIPLIHHNFDEGLSLLIEGNSTDSWPGTTLGTITVPAWGEDGFSTNAALDLTVAVPVAGDRTWRYWSISNLGDANSANIKIGEIPLVATLRYLERNILWGVRRPEEHLANVLRSKTGVERVYDKRSRSREFAGAIDASDAGLASWRSHRRGAKGVVNPWMVFPNGSDTEEALFVRFINPRAEAEEAQIDRNLVPFELLEVGRGEPT